MIEMKTWQHPLEGKFTPTPSVPISREQARREGSAVTQSCAKDLRELERWQSRSLEEAHHRRYP